MKRLVIAAALFGACAVGIDVPTWGHGGQYRGPGDTVPPGGVGAGGGRGPGTGGGGVPGQPVGPGTGGGPAGPGGPGIPGNTGGPGTSLGGMHYGPDLTQWSFWWEFNKDPYLNLKDAIHSPIVRTGSVGFYFGQGTSDQVLDTQRPTDVQVRQLVVPALLTALKNESNNDIITGCLIALAKIGDAKSESGDSAFEDVIIEFLDDSNQEISETAAIALGILANEHSIEILQHLLEDDDVGRELVGRAEVNYRTRTFAAYGLGLIGADAETEYRQTIVQILVNAISNDNTKSRDLKVSSIISLGLVPILDIEPEAVSSEGQALVPHLSRIGQIDYLLAFLENDDNNYMVRAHVPTALGRLLAGIPGQGDPLEKSAYETQKLRISESLLGLFEERTKEPREVVMGAILAMGLIGDADTDELDRRIRAALAAVPRDHSDAQARNFSLIAMAKVGSNRGSGEGVEEGAREAGKYLLKQLVDGKSSMQPWAGLGLGVMGYGLAQYTSKPFGVSVRADLAVALRQRLKKGGSPQSIGAYAVAAGLMGDMDSNATLLQLLEDLRTDETRGYVALGLGLGRVSGAREQIQKVVRESEYRPELLRQAAISLGLLGDNQLVEDLTEMLANATNLATQAAISSALGFIGDGRSITPLVEMLADDSLTATARGFAAVSLGIVADKESLPWNSKVAVDLNYRASTSTLTEQSSGAGIIDIR
ncbi:MAG: HEAT repeat protein [Planctomycetota bacterium]|jgi:HEAT repeat protein